MRNSTSALFLGLCAVLTGACSTHRTDQQPASAGELSIEAFAESDKYNRALDKLAELNAASDKSGLTALTLGSPDAHTWEKLDAYYQQADALPYPADIRKALKEKAIFGLVEVQHFLSIAPLEKRTYYAEQFFAQPYVEPKLAIAFLENLRNQWPAEKLAAAKAKTSRQLQASLARTTKKLPGNLILPDTKEMKKTLAVVQQEQQKRARQLTALQSKLETL
ncbi:hypothetical protein E5K00_03205 [Hymenobacter aquaticus]|uniref:Uncharacterized protein n=1 Tax=Hymenobacter aquaticus TaxID=1867101 RepID=A0A4Z0Q425_9BACT|nr:hypothetical protein [Hymenobacter aquaticus]TGE24236.1 hypothetical protein E5K00_03205 [Hymenobacter aquaticus]